MSFRSTFAMVAVCAACAAMAQTPPPGLTPEQQQQWLLQQQQLQQQQQQQQPMNKTRLTPVGSVAPPSSPQPTAAKTEPPGNKLSPPTLKSEYVTRA